MTDRTLTLISVDGPFTQRPSGEFKADGETPILRRCNPYWIVRVLHDTIIHDHQFHSEVKAREFASGIDAGTIYEEDSGGTPVLRGV